MATKDLLGFQVKLPAEIDPDIKTITLSVKAGDTVLIEEQTYTVGDESPAPEIWVEQGSEFDVVLCGIDDSGNQQEGGPKSFRFTATDSIKPAAIGEPVLVPIGEKHETVE